MAQVCHKLLEEALTEQIQAEQKEWATLKAFADSTDDIVDSIASAEPSQVIDMLEQQIQFTLLLNLEQ
jgi:hypothetical protein